MEVSFDADKTKKKILILNTLNCGLKINLCSYKVNLTPLYSNYFKK